MAKFTLGASKRLGDDFATQAADIMTRITDQDTLYLDDVTDAGTVSELLRILDLAPQMLPNSADPDGFKPPVW